AGTRRDEHLGRPVEPVERGQVEMVVVRVGNQDHAGAVDVPLGDCFLAAEVATRARSTRSGMITRASGRIAAPVLPNHVSRPPPVSAGTMRKPLQSRAYEPGDLEAEPDRAYDVRDVPAGPAQEYRPGEEARLGAAQSAHRSPSCGTVAASSISPSATAR